MKKKKMYMRFSAKHARLHSAPRSRAAWRMAQKHHGDLYRTTYLPLPPPPTTTFHHTPHDGKGNGGCHMQKYLCHTVYIASS